MSDSSNRARQTDDYIHDPERLEALRQSRLLDSPPEEAFDRFTRLASRLLGAPVALVSLVDDTRQFFKSLHGLQEPWASRRQTGLSHSFCQYVVEDKAMLVVEDARKHPILRDNDAIEDLNVVAYAGAPLNDRNGHTLGSFCVIHPEPHAWTPEELDILGELAESVSAAIELRELARDLRSREATLKSLVDSTGTLIWLLATDGKVLRANTAAQELTGVDAHAAAGMDLASAPWWSEAQSHSRRLGNAITAAANGRRTVFEATLVVRSRQHFVEFSVGPVVSDDGEVQQLVAEARDVSHRKRVERLRGNVTALLMQELRGPLGVSRGALQLLGRDRERFGPGEQRMLDLVTTNVDHVVQLLQDMLELTLLEDQGLNTGSQSVQKILERAVGQVRAQADAMSVSLVVSARAGQLVTDGDLTSRALALMLSHCIRRAPADTEVTAAAAAEGDEFRFTISDSGAAVPRERLARYFEVAGVSSGDATRGERREYERSQLGLTIARSIAELLSGAVEVRENERGGISMSLILPRHGFPDAVETPVETEQADS